MSFTSLIDKISLIVVVVHTGDLRMLDHLVIFCHTIERSMLRQIKARNHMSPNSFSKNDRLYDMCKTDFPCLCTFVKGVVHAWSKFTSLFLEKLVLY